MDELIEMSARRSFSPHPNGPAAERRSEQRLLNRCYVRPLLRRPRPQIRSTARVRAGGPRRRAATRSPARGAVRPHTQSELQPTIAE